METEPTISISDLVRIMKSYITYGNYIKNIYQNIFGKKIHSSLTDILCAVLVMFQKNNCENI